MHSTRPKVDPVTALILITYRCNSKCTICDLWKREPGEELLPEDYNRLPETLTDVNITGGEPFLRRDLLKILDVINKRCNNPRMCISTNGLLPELVKERCKDIKKSYPNVGVRVSIDGIEEYHNKIRGVPNAFEKAIKTIEGLKSIGFGNLGISLTFIDETIEQIPKVYELAREYDIQFLFQVAHSSEISLNTSDSNTPKIKRTELLKNIVDRIANAELKSWSPKKWYRSIYDLGVYRHAVEGTRYFPCRAGELFFWMSPDGDIFPAPIINWKFGNIRGKEFNDIWYSEEANRFRETIKPWENHPRCGRHCWMSCTVSPHLRENMFSYLPKVLMSKLKAHVKGKKLNIV